MLRWRRLWRNVGRTMAEYSVIDRRWEAGRMEVEGTEHADAARALGPADVVRVPAPRQLGNRRSRRCRIRPFAESLLPAAGELLRAPSGEKST